MISVIPYLTSLPGRQNQLGAGTLSHSFFLLNLQVSSIILVGASLFTLCLHFVYTLCCVAALMAPAV